MSPEQGPLSDPLRSAAPAGAPASPGQALLLPGVARPPVAIPHVVSLPAPRRLLGSLRRRKWLVLVLLGMLGAAGYAAMPLLLGPVIAMIPVRDGALVQSVVAAGRIETPHRVHIGSQITGTVASIPVSQGQAVEANATLVLLEDSEAQASAEQARGAVAQAEARLRQVVELTLPLAQESLQQAEANLANAQAQFARAAGLRRGGFETEVQVENTRRTLEVAEALLRSARFQVTSNSQGGTEYTVAQTALQQARATLQATLARLDYTRIRAPVAGTLITRNVEPGWVVQPGQVLMVLAPVGETQIVVQIDERNLGLVALGQPATASADAYPAERFTAELAYLNPGVDAQRASVEVKLRVPDPPEYLREDMTVSVDIAVATRDNTLILPVSAVHDAATPSPWVLRFVGGRAERAPVRIGLRGPRQLEILEGLRAGDLVVPVAAAVAPGGRVRAKAGEATPDGASRAARP
jgi:HlyD family secretion protein